MVNKSNKFSHINAIYIKHLNWLYVMQLMLTIKYSIYGSHDVNMGSDEFTIQWVRDRSGELLKDAQETGDRLLKTGEHLELDVGSINLNDNLITTDGILKKAYELEQALMTLLQQLEGQIIKIKSPNCCLNVDRLLKKQKIVMEWLDENLAINNKHTNDRAIYK